MKTRDRPAFRCGQDFAHSVIKLAGALFKPDFDGAD